VHRLRLAWLRLGAAVVDAVALAGLWLLAVAGRVWLGELWEAWSLDLVPGVDVFRDVDPARTAPKGWLVVPLWLLVLGARGRWHALRRAEVAPLATLASVAWALGVAITLVFLAGIQMSRTVLVGFALGSWPALVLARTVSLGALHSLRRRRFDPHRVLLVGTDEALRPWRAVARSHPEWGLEEVACVGVDEATPFLVRGVDEVMAGGLDDTQLLALAAECEQIGVPLSLDARYVGPRSGAHLTELDGLPVLTLGPRAATAERVLKRVIDVVGAAVTLVLAAPLLALLGAAVHLADGGPAWFVQQRVGRHGRRFGLIKLRTMRVGAHEEHAALAEEQGAGPLKLSHDPRVTPLGRWLRRTSLDELPQLVNVLRGEMSLVGPRPPLPEEVARYERWELRRLSVPPGMTGLWQVSGRSDLPWEQWVALDLEYVDRWSLRLDLELLARTVPAVLRGTGAR